MPDAQAQVTREDILTWYEQELPKGPSVERSILSEVKAAAEAAVGSGEPQEARLSLVEDMYLWNEVFANRTKHLQLDRIVRVLTDDRFKLVYASDISGSRIRVIPSRE